MVLGEILQQQFYHLIFGGRWNKVRRMWMYSAFWPVHPSVPAHAMLGNAHIDGSLSIPVLV